jgi:hypothetical protein
VYTPPAQVQSAAPAPKKLELSAFAGWQVNGDIATYAGDLVLDDAMAYGASLAMHVGGGAAVEFLWLYNDTTAHFASWDPFYPSTRDFSVQQHYFQIGGTRSMRRDKVEFFGGGTLGAGLFIPGQVVTTNGVNINASDSWTFAMTFGAGLKVHLSPKLALRGEARMLLPMLFQGGGFYVGTGGSGMSVSAGIPSVQGAFTGGLTFTP